MVVTVQELLPAPPEQVFALLTDVERMGGLGPQNVRSVWQDEQRGVGAVFRGGSTYLRTLAGRRPEQEERYVAGRAAELEAGMRATLRAAAGLLEP